MAPPNFKLTTEQLGFTLEANGADITDQVEAVELVARRDQPTWITVHYRPGADTSAGGVGLLARGVGDGEFIQAFLNDIDPIELEQDYLMSADASMSPTETMIEQLRARARSWPE